MACKNSSIVYLMLSFCDNIINQYEKACTIMSMLSRKIPTDEDLQILMCG